ncbi:MAG: ABC transporter ATP-binding protein [Candidatus Thorarchaeota archaeon]|jgi:NitT/TauT family transport system ATP-binding protein
MPVVEVRNVSHTFTKQTKEGVLETQAVCEANLSVEKDEFLVMLGPSGCGKTTLLRLIHGLIKPTQGEILVNGKQVEGPGMDRAFVFQAINLLPWRSTLHNVVLGLEIKGMEKEEQYNIAQKYIDMVGLSGFESHYPHELSGGMQQRVGIARALAVNPEILLMDEPFGYLDALTRMSLQQELLQIWSKQKKTCIFITHDLDESIFLGDRVVLMSCRPGRITETFPIDLPRPRPGHDIRNTAQFQEIRANIWEKLKEELANM